MLTRKQKWRRMRSARYNYNSGISKTSSSSSSSSIIIGDSGHTACSGGRTLEGPTPSTTMANASSSPGHAPPLPSAEAAAAAAAAIPSASSEAGTPPKSTQATPVCSDIESPIRPPSPLPCPPDQATPPYTQETSPTSPTEPPTPEEQLPQQQQQQQQQQSGNSSAYHPHHRHPLDEWRTSAMNLLKLLFFFDAGGTEDRRARHHHHHGWDGGGGGRNRAATEGCLAVAAASAAAAAARPRRSSEPVCRPPSPVPPPPKARVRFSHQIRVILVASRVEMSAVKADVWWAEKDYCDFRRAYLITAREDRERELDLCRRRGEGNPELERTEACFRKSAAPQVPALHSSATAADGTGDAGSSVAESGTHDGRGISGGDDLLPRPPDGGRCNDMAGDDVQDDDDDGDYENENNLRLLRTVSPRLPPPPPPSSPASTSCTPPSSVSKPRTPPASSAAEGEGPAFSDGKALDDDDDDLRAVASAANVLASSGHENGGHVGAVVNFDKLGVEERAPFATTVAPMTSQAGPSCAGISNPPGLLGAGTDLRIDPRTGGRIPLPFLGETPIRRVASV